MTIPKENNPMTDLINDKESGVLATNHILARIWRIILMKYGLSGASWQRQLNRYQIKQKRTGSAKAAANLNGNINRQLSDKNVSWNALMRGLDILEFDNIDMQLTLTRRGVTRVINVTSIIEEEEE